MLQYITLQANLGCVYTRSNTSELKLTKESQEINYTNVLLLPITC